MSERFTIIMGIPEPSTAESVIDVSTPEGMRRAIYKASWESGIIRQCLVQADHAGWSSEDRYTLLAYQALVALERTHQYATQLADRTANPFPVFVKGGA